MNNRLKGILAGSFVLLIALLLLSRCSSCTRHPETAQVTHPAVPPQQEVIVEEEEVVDEDVVVIPDVPDASEIGVDGVIKVTLQWNYSSDIDLHAKEPGGNHIYFGNRGHEGGTGGWLDMDNIPGGPGSAENMNWQSPAPGHYKIWVNYYSGNGGGPVKVTVKVNDVTNEYNLNMTHSGQNIDVVEFDYPTPGLTPQQ